MIKKHRREKNKLSTVKKGVDRHVKLVLDGPNDRNDRKKSPKKGARTMDKTQMENRIKDLLQEKIEKHELSFLHGFYEIPGLYRYSVYNQFLIMIQGGSICSSFNGWTKLGRYVKKGEHGRIEVLVPYIKTHKEELNGKTVEAEKCCGFFGKKVFDISQTDGKPLGYKNNSQEKIDLEFNNIVKVLGPAFGLEIETGMTGSARGYFNHIGKLIKISDMSNNNDKCKTLFHELGHAILHGENAQAAGTHSAKEVEAELVSLLVCNTLGVNFQESELYIKAYNQFKPDISALKVIGAVQKILKVLVPNGTQN